MNDIIQSILVAISLIGAIAWVAIKIVRIVSKSNDGCKDCPLVDQCTKKHHCHHSGTNCGCH